MFEALKPGNPATSPPPASRWRRFGAVLLDVLAFATIYTAVFALWGTKDPNGKWILNGLPACGTMLMFPVYWLATENLFGGTFGKRFLGLRVFSLAGPELEFRQVVKRNIGKLFEAPMLWLFSIGFSFANPLRQTPGDLWAKTLVTEDRFLREWRYGPGEHDFSGWLESFKKPDSGGDPGPPGKSGTPPPSESRSR